MALVLAGYAAYLYRVLDAERLLLESINQDLAVKLAIVTDEKQFLLDETHNQQEIIDAFQGKIQDIGDTVTVLNKLSQTDKELLKKYSKVYFLNENYVPAKLTQVDKVYIFDGGGTNFLIHTDVWPHLKMLLDNARSNNLSLLVASAFRSFDIQASLKSEYKVIYGAGTANQFSADQGYSEHQLGTAVDFTTTSAGGTLSKFQTDPAYKWLENNAYKFGFILSYPEKNTYYKFEPWHWRYVGVALAEKLHADNKYFYDLDQREIDAYLIKLFD